MAEYAGNGNGKWNGYQYVKQLRPDKTMHICKLSSIRCKRDPDTVLKALYNILRSHRKLETELSRHNDYVKQLLDTNWHLKKQLESYEYYKQKDKQELQQKHRITRSDPIYNNMQFQPHPLSRNSPDAIQSSNHHHNHNHNHNHNHITQSPEKESNLPPPPNTVNVM